MNSITLHPLSVIPAKCLNNIEVKIEVTVMGSLEWNGSMFCLTKSYQQNVLKKLINWSIKNTLEQNKMNRKVQNCGFCGWLTQNLHSTVILLRTDVWFLQLFLAVNPLTISNTSSVKITAR